MIPPEIAPRESTINCLLRGGAYEWIKDGRQEDLHLEFKSLPGSPVIDKDARKNFAKSVSAFANSDGGIVCWGIVGRRSGGIDAAERIEVLNGLAAVESQLNVITGDLIVPRISEIEHRAISFGNDQGILLTFVPASDAGPHMASQPEGRYYKRSGSSSYRMEHFDIADMFGRRRKPHLQLILTPTVHGGGRNHKGRYATVEIIVSMENRGRGIALYPYVALQPSSPYKVSHYELDGNGRTGLPSSPRSTRDPAWRIYAGGLNDAIHPGTVRDITAIRIEVYEPGNVADDLRVDYVIAADGVPAEHGHKSLRWNDLHLLALEQIARE